MALRRRLLSTSLAAIALVVPVLATAQIVPGQTDDFEDGTTQGWAVGVGPFNPANPAQPANVGDGGPGGDGDAYLQLTALGGDGPGSRLSVINLGGQWTGDYLASGITHIGMDVINLGSTDLFLRVMIADPFLGPPTNVAMSANAIPLAAGGGWTRIAFPLFGPNGLLALEGSVAAALANATELRIFHNEAFAFPPEPVVALVGVDNVTASVVPEPASILLVATGLLTLVTLGRRPPRR